MLRLRSAGVALVCVTVLLAATVARGQDATRALDRFLEERSQEGLAFVALVARGGQTVFAEAYGRANRKRALENRVGTAFAIGSISKTFTAAAIYRLAREGRLSLADTIDVYLDDVPADKKPITIEHLLEHRAGLPQYHDRRGDFERMPREKALRRILGAPLGGTPGEAYAYSNAGYTLLAILVEEVSGEPYREHLRKRFLDPLGMSRTGFWGERQRWREDEVATAYGDSREGKNTPWHWRADDLWAVVGNGGIVSTAEDMLRWATARERLFPAPDPPADLGAKRHFSQGWYLAHRETTGLQVFHGGALDTGFIAMLRSYPEHDTTLILLSNTFRAGEPHIRSYLDEIEDILFGAP